MNSDGVEIVGVRSGLSSRWSPNIHRAADDASDESFLAERCSLGAGRGSRPGKPVSPLAMRRSDNCEHPLLMRD